MSALLGMAFFHILSAIVLPLCWFKAITSQQTAPFLIMVISRTIIRWRTIQTLTKLNNPDPAKRISKHCGPYGQALNCNNNSYLSFAWFGIRYVVSGVLNAAVQSLPHWRSQQLILQLKKREALALLQLQMHSLNHLQISRPRTRVQIHTDGVPGITALLQLRLKTDQRRVTKN